MDKDLLFEFEVNKENNSITIQREFDAILTYVWKAWTEPNILDKWWAPKPWVSKTKSMDFKEGGHRFYAMCGPNGEEHWCLTTYSGIRFEKDFSGTDSFTDKNQEVNHEMPRSNFDVSFTPLKNNMTLVTNVSFYDSAEHLENTIQMGFKEGMSMALKNLDEYLHQLKIDNHLF